MKIFVTRKIPGNHLEELKSLGEVTVSEFDRPLTGAELVEKTRGADIILTLLTDRIDSDLMDAIGPQLKMVSNYAVGFDNVDVKAATDRGIVITNTPSDAVNEAVAEHTWALILALSRRIVEADESVRRGAYKGWEPDIFLGHSLIGKNLGIVGMGRIGKMVARRAKGFNLNILYSGHKSDPTCDSEFGAEFCGLEDLVAKCDFVSLHVPLTDETRGMINLKTLSLFKHGSFLINTSRGPVVKEKDLVEALRQGHLAGAGLDVFENEPNIDPELIGMQNVILTPHIASATYEAREDMAKLAVTAILDVSKDTKPSNIVNPEVWEKRRK